MIPLFSLLLTAAAAEPTHLRVTLDLSGDAPRVVRAVPAPGEVPADAAPHPGHEVVVLDEAGSRLASQPLHHAGYRSIILPEGGGEVARVDRLAVVHLPWSQEAASLQVDGLTVADTARLTRALAPELAALRQSAGATPQPLWETGDVDRRLDLVLYAEGYTAGEQAAFEGHAQALLDHLLTIEPYSTYRGMFNIWTVFTPSNSRGIDKSEGATQFDTAFECFYGCGLADSALGRLICCDEDLIDATVADTAPWSDGVLLLVNDQETYGGSGGLSYSTSYTGPEGLHVAAHELGHTLFTLWDEYSYGIEGDPDEFTSVNCVHDDRPVPWSAWMGEEIPAPGSRNPDTVDRVDVCSFTNWDRATRNSCMMTQLRDDYCPVCREHIVRSFYAATGGRVVDTVSHEPGGIALKKDDTVTVQVAPLGNVDAIELQWSQAGEDLGTSTRVTLSGADGDRGRLELTAHDPTPWVRSDPGTRDDPDGLLTETVTWKVSACGCDAGPGPSGAWAVLLGLLAARRRRGRAAAP